MGVDGSLKIRELYKAKGYKDYEIVMCSAYDSADVVEKARKCGMSQALMKPINPKKLEVILQNLSI